jgi:hypothetical protein
MANDSLLNTPVLWINKYLQDQIQILTNIETPFFPSTPSIIDDLTGSFPEAHRVLHGYLGQANQNESQGLSTYKV